MNASHHSLRTGDLIDLRLSSKPRAPLWMCVWIGGLEGEELRVFFASTGVGIVKFRQFTHDGQFRILAR